MKESTGNKLQIQLIFRFVSLTFHLIIFSLSRFLSPLTASDNDKSIVIIVSL